MKETSTKFEWAYTSKGRKLIHISELDKSGRGAKGYICVGCSEEMEACMGGKVKHYFRHSATQKEIGKCAWSDEKTRIRLFYELLQVNKKIKQPPLFLFDKEGSGQQKKVLEEKYLEFTSVKFGLSVAYTIKGLSFLKRGELSDKDSLLANPDAILFDKDGNALLCIHNKASIKGKHLEELKARYMFANLDAILITIPAVSSPEELNALIYTSQYSSWIYNIYEQKFSYTPTPGKKSGVFDSHHEQVFTPEETFECRIFQINESIRAINGLMGTADFKELQQQEEFATDEIEQDLREAEERLSNLESKLDQLEREENKAALDEAGRRLEKIKRNGETKISPDKGAIAERHRLLGERYLKRRREIKESAVRIRQQIEEIDDQIWREEDHYWIELEQLDRDQEREAADFEYYRQLEEEVRGKIRDSEKQAEGILQVIRDVEEETRKFESGRGRLSNAQAEAYKRKYN